MRSRFAGARESIPTDTLRRWRASASATALVAVVLVAATRAAAQEPGTERPGSGEGDRVTAQWPDDLDELAEELANELSQLVQVPIIHNFELGLGVNDDGFRYLLVTRPRIPVALPGGWLVVTNAVARFAYVDDVIAPDGTGAGSVSGTSDGEIYSLLSPPLGIEGLRVGAGPYVLLPAGNPQLGLLSFAAGPAVAVMWQGHDFVLNAHVTHGWSMVDDGTDYSLTSIFPSVSYVFDTGTSLVVQTEAVYEWHSGVWTVPLAAGVSQVVNLGPLLRMAFGIQGKWFVERPIMAPDWGIRLITTLLFPDLD